MEPFNLWTKIRRRFKCILRLEDYHDLGDLFKGHLGCCRIYLVVKSLSVI